MRYYDFKKAKKIISDNKLRIKSASLGMHEDWYWTAETIWEKGKFTRKIANGEMIAGIDGSRWATPVIELVFKNGRTKMLECYSQEGEQEPSESALWTSGPLSSEVQRKITKISKK